MSEYAVIYEHGPTSWGAYRPDLPGVGVVGDTREEVEQLIREGVELHIESLREQHELVPERTSSVGVVALPRHSSLHPRATGGVLSRQTRRPIGGKPGRLGRPAAAGAGASQPSWRDRGRRRGTPGRLIERVSAAPCGPATLSQTRPTGFSSVPPPGPATPVTPTPTSAPSRARAPSASACATCSETAPCGSISLRSTPASATFDVVGVDDDAARARTPTRPQGRSGAPPARRRCRTPRRR